MNFCLGELILTLFAQTGECYQNLSEYTVAHCFFRTFDLVADPGFPRERKSAPTPKGQQLIIWPNFPENEENWSESGALIRSLSVWICHRNQADDECSFPV